MQLEHGHRVPAELFKCTDVVRCRIVRADVPGGQHTDHDAGRAEQRNTDEEPEIPRPRLSLVRERPVRQIADLGGSTGDDICAELVNIGHGWGSPTSRGGGLYQAAPGNQQMDDGLGGTEPLGDQRHQIVEDGSRHRIGNPRGPANAPSGTGAEFSPAGQPRLSPMRSAPGRRAGTVPEPTTVLRSVLPRPFPPRSFRSPVSAIVSPLDRLVRSARRLPSGPYRRIDLRGVTPAKVPTGYAYCAFGFAQNGFRLQH